jgi:uncharacterized RmlC-like cupin family protein
LPVTVTLGSSTITTGAVSISPSALAVSVTLGNTSVVREGLEVTPNALAVSVTLGSSAVTTGAVTVSPSALAVSVTHRFPECVSDNARSRLGSGFSRTCHHRASRNGRFGHVG